MKPKAVWARRRFPAIGGGRRARADDSAEAPPFFAGWSAYERTGPYAEAMKHVARETATRLIDLHELSRCRYAELGGAGSAAFTVNQVDQAKPTGWGRTTARISPPTGAREMAALVARELTVIDPRLTRW